ncbi:MAG: gephyrin-like molybdotransferase Glp [Methanoregulaceae archaeon]|jgi:molybdopterin molybdotransferase
MSLFLKVVPASDAIAIVRHLARTVDAEYIPLTEAVGRVLSKNIKADIDIPGYDRSVVDGFAVRAADTIGANDAIPAMLRSKGRVEMGGNIQRTSIDPGQCFYVPTGGVLPKGANAVVMLENAENVGDEILIKKPVAHRENVLLYNEDFSKGELVICRGKRLTSQDIGVLAAVGCIQVPVFLKPIIGVLSTGNELVSATEVPGSGQIRDSNSNMVGSFVQERGCHPKYFGIVKDNQESLYAILKKAVAECDAVLISGGSSKDDRDMVASLIGDLGEVLIHGIAIAPGKPTIIGCSDQKPIIGLPGHPASAFIVLFVIVRHLIDGMTGDASPQQEKVRARINQNVPSQKGREDYVRVFVEGEKATPLFGKSGLLNTLVRSNGVIQIPAESEGLEVGDLVEVWLW